MMIEEELSFDEVVFGEESTPRNQCINNDNNEEDRWEHEDTKAAEDGEKFQRLRTYSVGSLSQLNENMKTTELLPTCSLDSLNNNKRIRVRKDNYARRHQAAYYAVVISNIPTGCSFDDLRNIIEKECGNVKSVDFIERRSWGQVEFMQQESIQLARDRIHQLTFFGSILNVSTSMHSSLNSIRNDQDVALKSKTLVLKNLPYSININELHSMWSGDNGLVAPLELALHQDMSTGLFRGVAYAIFSSIDEAEHSVCVLQGALVGGRSMRVEFKRSKNTGSGGGNLNDHSDDVVRQAYIRLKAFKESAEKVDIAFTSNLTSAQRKQIHNIAAKFGLERSNEGEGENRYVKVFKLRYHVAGTEKLSEEKTAVTNSNSRTNNNSWFQSNREEKANTKPQSRHPSSQKECRRNSYTCGYNNNHSNNSLRGSSNSRRRSPSLLGWPNVISSPSFSSSHRKYAFDSSERSLFCTTISERDAITSDPLHESNNINGGEFDIIITRQPIGPDSDGLGFAAGLRLSDKRTT